MEHLTPALVQDIRNEADCENPPAVIGQTLEGRDDWMVGSARIGCADPAFLVGLGGDVRRRPCLRSGTGCGEERRDYGGDSLSCEAANHPRSHREPPTGSTNEAVAAAPAGMAGIDRSGLIGGNVAGWVKGL